MRQNKLEKKKVQDPPIAKSDVKVHQVYPEYIAWFSDIRPENQLLFNTSHFLRHTKIAFFFSAYLFAYGKRYVSGRKPNSDRKGDVIYVYQ